MTLIVAALLAALGLRSVLAYRPIEKGSSFHQAVPSWDFGDPNPNRLSREDVRDVSSGAVDEVHIRYRAGGRFRYGLQLRNKGGWPITVTDVPLEAHGFAIGEGVRMAPVEGTGLTGGMIPLRPFRLAPGKERFIEISYRLNDCGTPPDAGSRSRFGWDTHRVDYSILGVPRRTEVQVQQPIVVLHGPSRPGMGCEAAG